MSGITSEAVVGFAKQGHPQAVAVLLNRELVPQGAHVKVRHKDEVLKILINFLRETEIQTLVNQVHNKLNEIQPLNIERVQLFTQQLGERQAKFFQEISLSHSPKPRNSQQPFSSKGSSQPQHSAQPLEFERTQAESTRNNPLESPLKSYSQQQTAANHKPASVNRYSIAEFLAQVSSSEELDIIEDHPFITGSCPHCSFRFSNLETPPLYWDCPECGWQDDLSQVIPSEQLKDTPQRRNIYQGKRLGSYLMEAGLLNASQIEVALADQQVTGLRLGEVLVRRGWIKEETVEYFMKKVIEPDRSGSMAHSDVYLKSSRNLLKTLIQQKNIKDSQSTPQRHTPSSLNSTSQNQKQFSQNPSSTPASANPVNERETLILPDFDLFKGELVNEKETLILPNLDPSEFLDNN